MSQFTFLRDEWAAVFDAAADRGNLLWPNVIAWSTFSEQLQSKRI